MNYPAVAYQAGWIDVDSECHSAVRIIPRGPSACDLDVRFRESGREYRYSRVDYGTVADYFNAPSKGQFFNHSIKPYYRVRRL